MRQAGPPIIEPLIAQSRDACLQALQGELAWLRGVPGCARTPDEWYGALKRVREKEPPTVQVFADLVQALRGSTAEILQGVVERFAVLNAFLFALDRMDHLPVDPVIKRLYCELVLKVAAPPPHWQNEMDFRGLPFAELAKLASLRTLPAGQCVFEYTRLPISWLLKFHPRDLPRTVGEIVIGLGGRGPVIAPHINHWRANPLTLVESEQERSLWLMVKSVERQPEVRGMMADGWFYSAEVGILFPHLAWLRQFFVAEGAHIVDMEEAPADAGFLVGSAKRRELYEAGQFRPRRTLILWRRDRMLAWAQKRADLAREEEVPAPASLARRLPRQPAGKALLPVAGYRRRPLVPGIVLLNSNPKLYMALTLLAPSLLAALIALAGPSPWLALPTFGASVVVMWLAQYFLLQ